MRRAGFRVTVAGSPEQALWFLDHALPIAIVSANHFTEGMSSKAFAELIRGGEEWASIVLVMLADPEGGNEALALADDVVGEGVTIASLCACLRHALLRRRVDALIAAEGARQLRGELADMTPIDLLRLLERLGESGTLGVETAAGPVTLWFKDGRVIDAVFGRFEGEEAVLRLLMAEAGSFELSIGPIFHTEVISGSSERLLSECLRQLDEWTRLCEEMPPLDTHLWVDHELFGRKRGGLSAEQLALIRSCNGAKTIREIVEESGLDLLLALEALRNLKVEGILIQRAPRWGSERASEAAGLPGLPDLPALPEPFPGLDASAAVEETPLVSGIPEELEEERPTEGPRDENGAGGLVRLSHMGGSKSGRYVFRPPERGASDGDDDGGVSSSIGQAISAAISGGERASEAPRAGLGLGLGGRWVTPAGPAAEVTEAPPEDAMASGLREVFARASGEAARSAESKVDAVVAADEPSATGNTEEAQSAGQAELEEVSALAAQGGAILTREPAAEAAGDVSTSELLAGILDDEESEESEEPGLESAAQAAEAPDGGGDAEGEGEAGEGGDAPDDAAKPERAGRSGSGKVLSLLRARRPVKVAAIEGVVVPPRGLIRAVSTGEIEPAPERDEEAPRDVEPTLDDARQEAMIIALRRPSVVLQPGIEAEVVVGAARLTEVARAVSDGGGVSAAYLRLVPESSGDFSRLNAFAEGRASASGAHLGIPRALGSAESSAGYPLGRGGSSASGSASYPRGAGGPHASSSASYPLGAGGPHASSSASHPLGAGGPHASASASYPYAAQASTSASYPYGPPAPRPSHASHPFASPPGLQPYGGASEFTGRSEDPFDADELAAIRGSRVWRWILLFALLVAAGGVVAWLYYPDEVEGLLGLEPPAQVIDEDEAP
ncbi:MAG: DUF4388 domain-containing protein [Nannocystaceae bacterium]